MPTEKKYTVTDAAIEVLREAKRPMTPDEIYGAIVEKKLFEFNAQSPVSIVRKQIRRHCKGIELKVSASDKYFQIVDDRKYDLA